MSALRVAWDYVGLAPGVSEGSIRYGILILAALLAIPLPMVTAADPFPEGGHTSVFWQGHPGPFRQLLNAGLDPTIVPDHGCGKASLVRGVQTHPVGLPNGLEPQDLPNVWTFGGRVEPDEITGFPTTTLTGVAQPVYVISDMDFTGLGEVEFEGEMWVACVRCAFDAIELDADPSGGSPSSGCSTRWPTPTRGIPPSTPWTRPRPPASAPSRARPT